MKKITSIILSLILCMSLTVPAFAGSYDEKPTIYVTGARVTHIYAADGTQLFPNDSVDEAAIIKEAIKPCLEKFAVGVLTNDYKAWAQEFHQAVIACMGELALDKNGEASDGSYPEHPYNYSLPKKSSNYNEYDYLLWYDWRLSPLETAELLKKYIDQVKTVTGEDKVNLLGRCYGANVVQTYLTLYPEHAVANVDDVAYLSSSVGGIDILGSLFTGNIELNDQAIENFVNYYMKNENLIEDQDTKALISTTVELLNYIKVLGITGESLELLIQRFKSDIFPLVLKDTFAGWPSYWAMVPADKYEEARDFIFAGVKDEYAGFIEKTDRYYNEVQLKSTETLLALDKAGIDFYIISKYNFPDIPIYENATALSDGNTTVERQSFGATCADHGEVFTDKYINSLKDTKYLSADRKINASTCLFPETSYFVKDMHHETFPYAINRFALDLMNNEATVSGGEYAQYMQFDGSATLKPVEQPDEDSVEDNKPGFLVFIRFFTNLFNFISKLFKGEVTFDSLLG